MKVRKAIFPVGGLGTRFYPITCAIPKEMLCIIDKPLIHYAFEEAISAGIEEFIFVTRHGKNSIEDYFDYIISNFKDFNIDFNSICYVRQNQPLGLGHAVLCAKNLINDEPFAVISADDLILGSNSCLGDMIQSYTHGNMAAIMNVPKESVSMYGILDVESDVGQLVNAHSVCEKPKIHETQSTLAIVGRYILSSDIFDVLKDLKPGANSEIQLTDALLQMIPTHNLQGFKFKGTRFDCGSKEGLLSAILHISKNDINYKCVVDNFFKSYKERL